MPASLAALSVRHTSFSESCAYDPTASFFAASVTPVLVGGAAAFKALEVAKNGLPSGTAMPFLVGMISAALSGLVAIWFVLAYLKRNNFNLFVIYRVVVGVGILILIVSGVRSGMGI